MAYHQPMMDPGSGLNISYADYRYQQNHSRFNDTAQRPMYEDQPRQQQDGPRLQRPKSTGELVGNVYGPAYNGDGEHGYYNANGQPAYSGPFNQYSAYDAPQGNNYPPTHDQRNSRNLPDYPSTYNPHGEGQDDNFARFAPPPQQRRSVQDPNPHHGRYSQSSALPWKMGNPPTSPDVRRTIGPGIAVPGFRSQPGTPGTPYIPIVENDTIRTYGSGVFPPRAGGPRKRALSEGEVQLNRQGTLLTPHATEKRASAELGIMLGSGRQKLKKGKLLPQGELPIEEKLAKLDQVKLEAKKGRKARVEVDVILESDVMVEGGELRGRLEVRIRKSRRGESLWIGAGKVRVCGFEEHSHTSSRHIFYHYPHQLPLFSPHDNSQHPLFASPPNEEGFRLAREGFHVIPFSVRLPVKGGAKGGWFGSPVTGVKYVVVGSIKLHTPETKKRSIAHFYRPCVIYPYVMPQQIFASTEHPTEVRTEQGLGWSLTGEKGKVRVNAELPRPDWVAGQNVWIKIFADNQSQKKIRTLNIALLEQVVLFKPPGSKREHDSNPADLSRYSAIPMRKKICEDTIEASTGAGAGYVGASGWWTGVQPGERSRWQASLMLPSKLLSIRRSRLIEVSYIIRLTLNNTITLDVPLNIINFLSIDPPPSLNLAIPPKDMTATDSRRMEMAVDSSVRNNEDYGGKQARYSANTESNGTEYLVSEKSPSRASKTKSQIFYPKDRQRLESIYQESDRRTPSSSPRVMPEPSSPFNKPRPLSTSSLPTETATSGSLPRNVKRESTASYFSAVASLSENEDLATVEARRRQGRKMSLAALTSRPRNNDDEEGIAVLDELDESDIATPQSGTFAPSVSHTASHEGTEPQELEEAERDLEFVRRVSSDHHEAISPAHQSLFERDSASRFLENDLDGETGYRSRYDGERSEDSHGSGLDRHVSSRSSESVRTSASGAARVEDSGEDEDAEIAPSPGPSRLSTQHLAALTAQQSRSNSGYLTADRRQHIAITRSVYGSIAASAISGISGSETELGQVVQAIRRDLSIRQAPLSGREALELRLRQARSPEPSGAAEPTRTHIRSNSLAPPLLHPSQAFNRRPSAPAACNTGDNQPSDSVAIVAASRANSVAIETIEEQEDFADDDDDDEQDVNPGCADSSGTFPVLEESKYTGAPSSHLDKQVAKSLRAATPIDGISDAPGLTPSIAEDSASSHGGSRASTPAQDRLDNDSDADLQVVEPSTQRISMTDHALEQLMLEADETMASLGLDSMSRKNVGLKYPLNNAVGRQRDYGDASRSPAGPRHRNSVSSVTPDSPLSQYSESLGHGQEPAQITRSPERTPVKEQTTPTRRSHTAILGGARNRFSNRTSGTSHTTDYMTHSPRSSIQSHHMVMTPGRQTHRDYEAGQYHLEDIPEVKSMASDPSLRKKGAERNSVDSTTSAISLERMMLERKGSRHAFPYSDQMTGYTNEQLQPKHRLMDAFSG